MSSPRGQSRNEVSHMRFSHLCIAHGYSVKLWNAFSHNLHALIACLAHFLYQEVKYIGANV